MTSRLREAATRVVVLAAILLSAQQFVSAQTTNSGNGTIICQVTMGKTKSPGSSLAFLKATPSVTGARQGDRASCVQTYDNGRTAVTVKLDPSLSADPDEPPDEPKDGCYVWYATALTSDSPFVAIYGPDDMNSLKHEIKRDPEVVKQFFEDIAKNACTHIDSVAFYFPGQLRWVQLWAYPKAERGNVPRVSGNVPPPGPPVGFYKVADAVLTAFERPGGTDVLVSWNYSPSAGPQKVGAYSNLQPLFHIGNSSGNNWLGLASLVDVDTRTTGASNPDSIINSFVYLSQLPLPERKWKYLSLRPSLIDVRTGFEYARNVGMLNEVSSVSVRTTFATRFWGTEKDSISFSPTAGFEVGKNLFNDIAPKPSYESYGLFRWVVGADAGYRVYPYRFAWLLGSKPYTVSASFRVRFPEESEVFTENILNAKGNAVIPSQTLDTRPRIYGRVELSQPLSRILAATVLYQYGDLPPAYRFFGHAFSFGLRASSPTDYEH